MTNAAHPPPDAWSPVAALIDACDADGVAAAVRDLDEDGRRAVAAGLPGHLKEVLDRRDLPWDDIDAFAPAFRAAGAGTLGGAAAVATWLNRREFNSRWIGEHGDTARLLGLLSGRDGAWRADLARRLALRVRGPRHVGSGLALALLAETGTQPPDHDPLVVGWVSSGTFHPNDPLLPALLPRVFEAEGVGRELSWDDSAPETLAAMAARGGVDRGMLLDGCVRRFLRGGTEIELRFFARLHRAVVHGDASVRRRETSGRARDYAALLPSAPGPVAGHVLELLREVPDLPSPLLVESLDGLLFRPEAGLVRSGLSWLRETLRDRPELADDCARALAQAFGHEKYTVQQKAAQLALALPDGTDGAPLADAVPLLPSDLGKRVAERFGGEAAEAEPGDEAVDDPAPEPLRPLRPREPVPAPPPITTPAELARAFDDLDRSIAGMEGLMAAFVELARTEPDAVRAALRPVLSPGFYPCIDQDKTWDILQKWLVVAGRMLAGSAPVPSDWRRRMPGSWAASPVDLLALHRVAELVAAVEGDALPPLLLATPTDPAGHLDPAVLVDRLRTFAEVGAAPGPADLQQALLRLPRGAHPDAAERAARLDMPAARTAARWLADPPVPHISVQDGQDGRPRTTIALESVAGPLADPGLDTTFPFAEGDEVDAAPARPPGPRPSERRAEPVTVELVHTGLDVSSPEYAALVEQTAQEAVARFGLPEVADMVRATMLGTGTDDRDASDEKAPTHAEADGASPDVGAAASADAAASIAPARHAEPRPIPEPGETFIVTTSVGAAPRRPQRFDGGGPTGLPLVDEIMTVRAARGGGYRRHAAMWPTWLPSHRDVAAGRLVAELRRDYYHSSAPGSPPAVFFELTPANGPLAENIADFLARCLGHPAVDRADRHFLDVCGRGDLPAAALGRRIDRLLRDGGLRPSRVARGLELAAEAGAFADVWRVLAVALPLLCPDAGERPVHGLDRLIALGTRTARWCGARETIPEVDALAARKGSAAYVRAARDLAAQLAA